MVDVSKYIERADQEVKRKNFDQAVQLYLDILKIEPDCGEACAGFLRACLRKHERRYPPAIVRGILNLPANVLLGLAGAFKARAWTVGLCQGGLRNDPKNPRLAHRMGHALLALGHRKSAEAAFQVVAEHDQRDDESLRILGQLAYERKDLEAALGYYERALKINPRDQEAARMRKNLAAEGAIQRGGFESARSARDLAKSDRQLQEAERAQRIVRTAQDVESAIREVEGALEAAPEDRALLLRLGDLRMQIRDMDAAIDAFTNAARVAPDDEQVKARLGDARIRRFETRIAEAEKEVQAGQEGAEDRLKRLRREHLDLQIEELARRVAVHPTDLGLRFQLGRALLRDERVDEAIEQLQAAVKDPKHRLGSLHLMGRAFARKGILDLAAKQLREAADAIPGMTDQRKEILYDLARVHERRGAGDEALAILKQIYEADISYRDVGQKIAALSG